MTERLCSDCKQRPLRYNNRSGFCGECYNRNRPRNIVNSEEWVERNNKVKDYYLSTRIERVHYQRLRKYGLSLDKYHQMLRDQFYACAICERRIDELSGPLNVDHDHACCATTRENPRTCGQCVRSLLCTDCNQGLGRFRDDTELLRKAIAYLS